MTSRREFLKTTSVGLAVTSGFGDLILRADAAPTREPGTVLLERTG
jgi:hypothetical protein